MKKAKRITLREKRRTTAAAAMPEVKRLVRRFGRAAVGNCLKKIADYEKELTRLSNLKKEVAALERKL